MAAREAWRGEAWRGVRTTRRRHRRRPPHTPTLPLPTSFIFTVALDAQRNELVCIVVVCMCLMVVPACPIYPSLYTKKIHHYTRREARQGKQGEMRRLFPSLLLPLPSASLPSLQLGSFSLEQWNKRMIYAPRRITHKHARIASASAVFGDVCACTERITWVPLRLGYQGAIIICRF
jgi:hypothetical protein